MSAVQELPEYREELADLQREALKIIALAMAPIGYAWLYAIVWSLHFRTGPPWLIGTSSWCTGGLLTASATLSYVLRAHHLSAAKHVAVWGLLAAVASAAAAVALPQVSFLFVLPVISASVLYSKRGFLLLSAMAAALATNASLAYAPGPTPSGEVPPAVAGPVIARLLSTNVAFPLLVIAFVTLACWLSSRSLYKALSWTWSGYQRALRNEQLARERQAELGRALKALDEATYRLERANYMLGLARDQAEESRRLKQQFAQTISHELRTPLNLIVGYTELMAESPEYYGARLPPAYLRDLSVVYRNARHLQGLVNDVLDLARIEAAQMALLPEQVAPEALVQEVLGTIRNLVASRGLALEAHIQDELPVLSLDPLRIRQVLFNLLNNALRFTDTGGITISVWQEQDEVIFAVADTGVGISPENLPRIFEEFQQADGSTRRRHEGAGLGLAISQQFVQLHGGRMWAHSELGKGSTFYFSLPVAPTDRNPPGPRPASQIPAGSGEEPVLLAVTRSLTATALLTRHIHGCRTIVVSDLNEAQKMVQAVMPQVVVIDPAVAGYEKLESSALGNLAQRWGLANTPLVICPLPGEEPLQRRLAVDGCLVKPVTRQGVWDALRRFGANVNHILIVDDDHDFVRLLTRILEDSPLRRYSVASAYSGQQALTKIQQDPPDLILLDVALPDISGLEVVAQMRANPDWQKTPIILVSAHDLSYQDTLSGPMVIAKAGGLRPGEVVRWLQPIVDEMVKSSPATATLKAASAQRPAFPGKPSPPTTVPAPSV